MARTDHGYIDWDEGREGYVDLPTVAYAPVHRPAANPPQKKHQLSIRGEELAGSLIAAAGVIWSVYVATIDYTSLWRIQIMPPGPIEICGLGILAWLHAKWRRSASPN